VELVELREEEEVVVVVSQGADHREGEEDSRQEVGAALEIEGAGAAFRGVALVVVDGVGSEVVVVKCFLWFLGRLGEWSYEKQWAEGHVLALSFALWTIETPLEESLLANTKFMYSRRHMLMDHVLLSASKLYLWFPNLSLCYMNHL
jgi:hypothetical protein